MNRIFSTLILLAGIVPGVSSQTNFYAPDTVQKIEITFTQPNWDYQMDTSKYGSEGYILAAQVRINGISYDSCGVKYKGYSSFDSTRVKNPLHIKLDFIRNNQNHLGFEDIKLSNGFSDPSSIREVLSYEILRNYMDAPESNFAKVYINGNYYGLMSSSESIDKAFLSKHFYSSGNSFFKCNPASVVSSQIPNLLYLGTDSANYYNRYEIKSTTGWKDLIHLCDTLANQTTHIDSILDVDRALWMLAYNNVTVNLDSYTGAFAQNYYLYRDDNERFVPVIWDLNMCFGSFSSTGTGNLNITAMQNMSPVLHATYGARPLIMNLLAQPMYKKMYIAHMRTLNAEFMSSGNYLTRAQTLQTLIDTCVKADSNGLYTYPVFQTGLTVNQGNIPGLSNLMSARATYLNSTSEFQQVPPTISTPSVSPSVVNLNDTAWITCRSSLPSAVYLGYRFQPSDRFRRILMYDDGLHHDGAAGDSLFGLGLVARSAEVQYYIYAENSVAGIFSPARAEHEFHSISVQLTLPQAGDLAINEFMSYNVTDTTDELGQHDDWIELYNKTSNPVNLYGCYITDDAANLKKFAFPNPSVIPANGMLSLWADEDPSTAQYIHVNFNLSSLGEKIILSTINGTILDSISFTTQQADSSYGRCPNGTGSFAVLTVPTFNSTNCGTGIHDWDHHQELTAYPNPTEGKVNITLDPSLEWQIVIFNAQGVRIETMGVNRQPDLSFDMSHLPAGPYLFSAADPSGNIFRKIILRK